MNCFKSFLKLILIMGAVMTISACSKTVQWEEEVPLNTGEVIWVKRTDTFVKGTEPGNPLKSTWGLRTRSIEFELLGQSYKFETHTTYTMMIHVEKTTKEVAVIAWTTECSKRGYGEFRWINGSWHLQPSMNPTLIGQPRNLMQYHSAQEGVIPFRVTQKFIQNSHFGLPQKGSTESHLFESRIATNCSGKK
jgi:hypothetical protein